MRRFVEKGEELWLVDMRCPNCLRERENGGIGGIYIEKGKKKHNFFYFL